MKNFFLLISYLLSFQMMVQAQIVRNPMQKGIVNSAQNSSTGPTFQLGYCDDEIYYSYGKDNNSELSGAIYITPELINFYKNNQVRNISIGLYSDVTELSVFIVKELSGTKLVDQTVGTATKGWHEITLDNPYTLTGEGFYVGYTCKGNFPIGYSKTYSEHGNFFAVNGVWLNLGGDPEAPQPSLNIRIGIAGDNMPNDLSLENADRCGAKKGEKFTISGVVKSRTTVPIESYEITYRINGGEPVSQEIETYLDANETETFKIEAAPINEIGKFPIQVSITKVNRIKDANETNNTQESIVGCKDEIFKRKVVIEEGTGTWCGWCVRGIVSLLRMSKKYSDSFIGIAVHNDDDLAIENYKEFIGNYFSKGLPSSVVNRKTEHIIDPFYENVERAYLAEIKQTADAKIIATAQYTSEEKQMVKVNTQSMFSYPEANASYKIAFVILENKVKGYKQNNTYAGGKYGSMGGFENLDAVVELPLDDVAREIYDSYTGIDGSVPTTIANGETYTYSYELALPTNIKDKQNIELVALLINSKTKEIMNADKVEIKEYTTGIKQAENHPDVQIYAEDGIIKADKAYDILQIYTNEGIQIANSHLHSGIYVVRIVIDNHIYIKKIAL